LLSREAVAEIQAVRGPAPLLRILLPWLGLTTVRLPYRPHRRVGGRSSYTWPRMVGLSLEGVVGYSTAPLRIIGGFGIVLALASFAYLAYVIVIRFGNGAVVPGWASVAGLVALIGGVQLIVLAVLGEYLARVFSASAGRPPYVIRSRIGERT
jgi:dolichol-phosphate mannosyltransferase